MVNGLGVRQAQRKQFRVDPAIVGSCVERAITLGRSWDMFSREILKFSFSKVHIWCILRENYGINEKVNQNLR